MGNDRAKLLSPESSEETVHVISVDEDKEIAVIQFPDEREEKVPLDKLCR